MIHVDFNKVGMVLLALATAVGNKDNTEVTKTTKEAKDHD